VVGGLSVFKIKTRSIFAQRIASVPHCWQLCFFGNSQRVSIKATFFLANMTEQHALLVERFKFLDLVQQIAAADVSQCVASVGLDALHHVAARSHTDGAPTSLLAGGPIGVVNRRNRIAQPRRIDSAVRDHVPKAMLREDSPRRTSAPKKKRHVAIAAEPQAPQKSKQVDQHSVAQANSERFPPGVVDLLARLLIQQDDVQQERARTAQQHQRERTAATAAAAADAGGKRSPAGDERQVTFSRQTSTLPLADVVAAEHPAVSVGEGTDAPRLVSAATSPASTHKAKIPWPLGAAALAQDIERDDAAFALRDIDGTVAARSPHRRSSSPKMTSSPKKGMSPQKGASPYRAEQRQLGERQSFGPPAPHTASARVAYTPLSAQRYQNTERFPTPAASGDDADALVSSAAAMLDMMLQEHADVDRRAHHQHVTEPLPPPPPMQARSIPVVSHKAAQFAVHRGRGAVPAAMLRSIIDGNAARRDEAQRSERLWNSSSVSQFAFADRLTTDLLDDIIGEVADEVAGMLDEAVDGVVDYELQTEA
jgi:hypothetical protein